MANYRSTSRNWVKLWVNEWLDGTTRLEMTGAQRAFWADLLTLAGRSRIPGVICSGQEPNGNLIGYPLIKLKALVLEEIDVESTLNNFLEHGKISILYVEGPPKLVTIHILSWEKYQSEYHRQVKYRKGIEESYKKSDTPKNTKVTQEVTLQKTRRLLVEGEVEGEVEEEGELNTLVSTNVQDVEDKPNLPQQTMLPNTSQNDVEQHFEEFWTIYPRHEGRVNAVRAFRKLNQKDRIAAIAGIVPRLSSGFWSDPKFIPHPATYLNGRRWEDEIGAANGRKSLDKTNLERLGIRPKD